MLAQELEIYKSTRRLITIMLSYTRNVSKDVKYAEWTVIRQMVFESMDVIYLANSESDAGLAAKCLDRYLALMFGVQTRVRVLAETEYLRTSFKTRVIEQVDECQKQATAWRKYFRRKSQN